jgi:hypothetical protein
MVREGSRAALAETIVESYRFGLDIDIRAKVNLERSDYRRAEDEQPTRLFARKLQLRAGLIA